MTKKSLQLTEQVYDYMLSVSLHEPTILKELRKETEKHPLSIMQIAPEQGQFFAFVIKTLKVRNAIEIGVFTGYSSLSIALALPDDGMLIACDNDAETTKIAQRFWKKAGVANKIKLCLGPAIDSLDNMIRKGQENHFDFGFIDAHKPEYTDYYERLLKLVRPGGVIAIDNVLWSGQPAYDEHQDENTVAIRQFNQHLYQDDRVFLSMLPLADGVTLALKK